MVKGKEQQPINSFEWVKRDSLKANDYNPNRVAPVELELLKTSIKLCGWTQPIVARRSMEIVDGFHRWIKHNKCVPLSYTTEQGVIIWFCL